MPAASGVGEVVPTSVAGRTRLLGLGLLPAALVALALTIAPAPAGAAIAMVQKGSRAWSTGSTVTASLPSASRQGTLLVAALATGTSNTITAPSGWTQAVSRYQSSNGQVAIWYRAANPGGITSVTFGNGSGGFAAQLSEWSGIAASSPLDQTGTNTASSTRSLTVSTGSTTAVQELGIAVFTNSSGPGSYTAGSGWTNLFSDTTYAVVADYRLGLAKGTVSETETDANSNNWVGAIATFEPPCAAGSLSLTAPSSVSFPGLTLNGRDQTVSTTFVLTPDDETVTGAGWNISGTSTTFTSGGGRTLSTSATTVTGASAAAASGTCSLPTNSVGYPIVLPAGSTAPAPVKLYDAATGTGAGPSNVTLSAQLAVPANAYSGAYSSTWTFTISSGP